MNGDTVDRSVYSERLQGMSGYIEKCFMMDRIAFPINGEAAFPAHEKNKFMVRQDTADSPAFFAHARAFPFFAIMKLKIKTINIHCSSRSINIKDTSRSSAQALRVSFIIINSIDLKLFQRMIMLFFPNDRNLTSHSRATPSQDNNASAVQKNCLQADRPVFLNDYTRFVCV